MKRALLAACLVLGPIPAVRAQSDVFLITELALRDPHPYASIPLFGCQDVTDTVLGGLLPSVNDQIAEALSTDSDLDGLLDLSPIVVSLREDQVATASSPGGASFLFDPAGTGGEMAFHFAACAPPQASASCEQDPTMPVQYSLYENAAGGTCLAPAAGTTGGYSPAILMPQAPCLVSDPFVMTMDVAGLHLVLQDTRIGATYVGAPVTSLVDGLIIGFLPEAAADTVLIAGSVPIVGGQPVSSILPGGTGCCSSRDDRDLGPDGQTMGWWLHFNFVATPASFLSTGAPLVAPAHPGAAPQLALPAPNPFTDRTTVEYSLPAMGEARVRVLDVTGRTVADLVNGTRAAGTYRAEWAGTDAAGSAVTPGVYFLRLEWEGSSRTRRVIRLR